MAKAKKGGSIDFHPHLDKPKNVPGAMPLQNKKFSGGSKMGKQGGPSMGKGDMGGSGGKGHGLHGAAKAKAPKKPKKK